MTKKNIKAKQNKYSVASLFSGAGGMDLGFKMAGFELLWANDNDADSVETYKKNIDNRINLGDIEKIDISAIPKTDVVVGGFPCQGFSMANMNRKIEDERNILYKYFVKIVTEKQPKIFIAENVRGILNIGGGKAFKMILNDFSNAGYDCEYTVVNASHYGVPQARQRVIIMGVRRDLSYKVNFPPQITHAQSPYGKVKKIVSVGDALKNIPEPEEKHNLKNHVYSKFKVKLNGYICNRPLDPNKPSPTVTARGDGKGGAVIMHHPSNHRRLSCRELSVLQGFPLNFEFIGAMTSVYRQIGNAVPPPLGLAIANMIKDALSKKERILKKSTIQEELFK